MKKSLFFASLLIVMLIVFSYGVYRGISGNEYVFDYQGEDIKPNSFDYYKIPKELKYKNRKISNISGTKTTINGVPVGVWFGKGLDKPLSIASNYLKEWKKKGFLTSSVMEDSGSFVNAIDPETKVFHGAITFGDNKKDSTVIPFSVDMNDSNPEDKWDRDFPRSLKKRKGFHMRTENGNEVFEKCYYLYNKTLSHAASEVSSQFKNSGWQEAETHDLNTEKWGMQKVLVFTRDNKNCIINVAAAKGDKHKSVVAIMIGTNI